MPSPSLVSVPVEVPMALLIVVLPAPPTVSAKAPPIAPERVSKPASELMREAAARVMAPA